MTDHRAWRKLVRIPHPELTPRLDILPTVTEHDLHEWEKAQHNYEWTYASSMPYAPHQYLVKGRDIPPAEYYRVYALIAQYGEDDTYRGYHRVYLYSTDRKTRWWAMSDYPQRSKIINRAYSEKGWDDDVYRLSRH